MHSENLRKKDVFDYISPFTKRYIKPLFDFFKKHSFYTILLYTFIAILSLLLISYLSSILIKAAAITFLIIIGGVSKIYQRYTTLPIGFEFVMFSTVVAGYLYGSIIGGMVGILSFALSIYFSTRYTLYVLPSFIIYFLAGVLTPLFNNLILAGIVFSVIFVLILTLYSLVFLGSNPARIAMYAFSSLSWNIGKFVFIVPLVIDLFPKS